MEFIDLKKQYSLYKCEIDAAIHRVLDSGHYVMGGEVAQIEQQLAQYVGSKHCITASSGTDTLLMALMALNIGPGDEVITTPFTWISTAEVVSLLGARPVFIDIDEDTFNLDVNLIERAITPKTKAIMPVSLFGQIPDMDKINGIAKVHNLPVIEDAAQSFGATYKGKQSCGLSQIGSTSFFPAKPFGCYGDGGALFTSDDELANKMRAIRTHGGIERHKHHYIGINGRFDTIQAAVLLAKFPHFPGEVEMRAKVGRTYDQLLKGVCTTPVVPKECTSTYAMYTIKVNQRDAVANELKQKNIPTGVYYPVPLHRQICFEYLGYKPSDFPVTERVASQVLSIPMHPWLTEDDQCFITDQIKLAVKKLG